MAALEAEKFLAEEAAAAAGADLAAAEGRQTAPNRGFLAAD